MNCELALDHPVRVAAESAIRAADEAVRAARDFAQCCETEHGPPAPAAAAPRSPRAFGSTDDAGSPRRYSDRQIKAAVKLHLRALTGPKNTEASGTVPNVRWRSITDAVLALHPRFTPLPDAMDIQFTSLSDLTKFAQGSWQNEEIHKCRITTRNLIHALGLSSCKALASGMSILKKKIGLKSIRSLRHHLSKERPTSYGYLCKTTMNCRDVVVQKSENVSDATDHWIVGEDGIIASAVEPLLCVQICFGRPTVGERLIVYAQSADTQVKFWKLRPIDEQDGSEGLCVQLVGTGHKDASNFCAGVQHGSSQVTMMVRDGASANASWLDETTWIYSAENGTFRHKSSGYMLV